jgi:hypothetical protein
MLDVVISPLPSAVIAPPPSGDELANKSAANTRRSSKRLTESVPQSKAVYVCRGEGAQATAGSMSRRRNQPSRVMKSSRYSDKVSDFGPRQRPPRRIFTTFKYRTFYRTAIRLCDTGCIAGAGRDGRHESEELSGNT